MISALPLLLARRAASAVDAVAGPTGLFAAPCASAFGPPPDTIGDPAVVHATLGALDHDTDVGARSAGETLKTPFAATVVLQLIGPKTPTLTNAALTPAGITANGRDLMLSAVMDRLMASDETGGNSTDTANILAGGRRLSAEWRYDSLTSVTPETLGDRTAWRLETQFRGTQTLSAVPAEGGHILQIEIDAQNARDTRTMDARIDATTDDLPISIIANIGPENATQLASFGIIKLVDLLRIPKTQIDATAAEIAGPNTALEDMLKLLHIFLDLRRGLVLNGINTALLDQPYAQLTLNQAWDGTTLTLPSNMPADQALRVEIMAKPLLQFIRPDALPRLTLGQLSTAKGEL